MTVNLIVNIYMDAVLKHGLLMQALGIPMMKWLEIWGEPEVFGFFFCEKPKHVCINAT